MFGKLHFELGRESIEPLVFQSDISLVHAAIERMNCSGGIFARLQVLRKRRNRASFW